MDGIPLVSCQYKGFRIGKYKVKEKWYLKGDNFKNPTKWQDINLKIQGRIDNNIIDIIQNYPHEKSQVKMVKTKKSMEGSLKGGLARRLLESKW